MAAITEIGYLSQEQAACHESKYFRQAAERAEVLIELLEKKKIPLSGRTMTGFATREEREKQVFIYGERKGGIRSIKVNISEIPKGKLIHWVGDLTFAVPASTNWSPRKGFEEIRKWSDPRARITFRTYGQEEMELSPSDPVTEKYPFERIFEIFQALDKAVELIGSVGQRRTFTKDLSGTTLVLD